jgi:hypothetical protein
VAKPIEPTPPLEGEEAEKLLRQLKDVCSPQEAERRLKLANAFWDKYVRPSDWEPAEG